MMLESVLAVAPAEAGGFGPRAAPLWAGEPGAARGSYALDREDPGLHLIPMGRSSPRAWVPINDQWPSAGLKRMRMTASPGSSIKSNCKVESVLVSEDELREGMRFLYARAKLAAEPAGAAAVAALLAGKIPIGPRETVVAVVSGGNVAAQTAAAILAGE